jgi:hypothetical protein
MGWIKRSRCLRRVRVYFRRCITRQQALAIAHNEVVRCGLPWREPVFIRWGWTSYIIWTNADMLGGNVIIRVRKRDGAVMHIGMPPR